MSYLLFLQEYIYITKNSQRNNDRDTFDYKY